MNKNAIILASGPGMRMHPWTLTCPKVLFKIKGKSLLDWHIDCLKENGIKNIIITAHYLSDRIRKATKEKIFHEYRLIGSGGACRKIMRRYRLKRAVIIYGDTYFSPEIYTMIPEVYAQNDRNFIFTEDPGGHSNGLIRYNWTTGKITTLSEKKKISDPDGRNAGIMILNSSVLTRPVGDLMSNVLHRRDDLYAFPIQPGVDMGVMKNYIRFGLENYGSPQTQVLLDKFGDTAVCAIEKILRAERIFIAGNGGSLATANHLALDWSKVGWKQVINLSEPGELTAYGNDIGFEAVFSEQLKRYRLSAQDVIVLISASGNSPNIVKVMDEHPKNIVGFTGNRGKLNSVKHKLPVDSDDIRVIEDSHLCYGHSITEMLEGLNG
ncbi:MAG: sugar phosphate nucleotidyltransferase [Planctomycetota bacterium]|nr:sugar phosphate nucleotidyltransferase [Planctomycetota bacterium]